MSKACVCQGSNENCRYCSGSGFVHDSRGLPSKFRGIQFTGGGGTNRKPRSNRGCPQCGLQVRRLQKHLKRCQAARLTGDSTRPVSNNQNPSSIIGEPTTAIPKSMFRNLASVLVRFFSGSEPPQQASSQRQIADYRHPDILRGHASDVPAKVESNSQPKVRMCSLCGASFNDYRQYYVHRVARNCQAKPRLRIETIVPKRPVPSSQSRSKNLQTDSPSTSNELLTCLQCGARVKAKKIDKHRRIKCPKRVGRGQPQHCRTETRSDSGSLANGQPSSKQKSALYDQLQGRDRHDATKSYAYPYREQGRFGSHASHDGFDDESAP